MGERNEHRHLHVKTFPQGSQHESALDMIASASPDQFYLFDLSGRYQYASPAAAQAVGLAQAQFVGKTWHELGFPAEVMEPFDRARESVVTTGQPWRGEIRFPFGPGARDAAHEYILAPVLSARGEIRAIVATVRDVTERKRAEDAARYQAVHDALTGLPNRVLLQDRLQQSILGAGRHRLPLAVLLLDLDYFKGVNDTFGHQIGDQVLREVCSRWKRSLRASDTLARIGGDEFVALLPETDEAGVTRAVQTLRDVTLAPWATGGSHIVVDVSIGIAIHPYDGVDADALLKHADDVMYREKRAKGEHRARPTAARESEEAITPPGEQDSEPLRVGVNR